MKNSLLIIGLSVTVLSTIASTAFAETPVTMNQPDNGFFEGPSPEWAVPHATDWRGTEVHRGYHRAAVKTLLQYLPLRRTSYQADIDREFHQDRNMNHRHFHTAPPVPFNP